MVLLKLMNIMGIIRVPSLTHYLPDDSDSISSPLGGFGLADEPSEGLDDSGEDEEEPSAFGPEERAPFTEDQVEPSGPSFEEDPAREDEVRRFWRSRNPRGAVLYFRDGRPAVDPELLAASAEGVRAWEAQNSRYQVEMYGPAGGLRARSGGTHNHTPQPATGRGAAMDFVIIDQSTGQMLTNHPAKPHQHQGKVGLNAPIYQSYYNEVVRAGARQFRRFKEKARFGGYFATGANAMDIMHIDLRGLEVPMGGGSLRSGFTAQQMRNWRIPQNHPYHQ